MAATPNDQTGTPSKHTHCLTSPSAEQGQSASLIQSAVKAPETGQLLLWPTPRQCPHHYWRRTPLTTPESSPTTAPTSAAMTAAPQPQQPPHRQNYRPAPHAKPPTPAHMQAQHPRSINHHPNSHALHTNRRSSNPLACAPPMTPSSSAPL